MTVPTVKARERHGSSSYELTIPAEYKDKFDVAKGDVFEATAEENDDGELVLTYKRVYKQPE